MLTVITRHVAGPAGDLPRPAPRASGGAGRRQTGRRAPPPPRAVAAPDAPAARAVRPLRVLIVEDEALVAMEIEDLLEELGAEVVGSASDADEAIRLAEALRPDCATMDIRLRGERDGISVATEIYLRFGIRSVFVSAHGDAGTQARAADARPIGWLAKPLARERLATALRRVGDSPEEQDADRGGD
jgi:two-component system, response regulator PdtaR